MKCFYHPQSDAVGICKNCNKGLCRECAIDVGNGIACKDNCEAEVKAINEVINRSKTAYQKTSRVYSQGAIFNGLAGITFLIFGLIESITPLRYFLIALGIVFLIGAIFYYSASKKFARQ